MNPQRYHLTLTVPGGRRVHGWWGSETTARGKFSSWLGEWGRDGARISLVDEDTGTVLEEWPGVVGGQP